MESRNFDRDLLAPSGTEVESARILTPSPLAPPLSAARPSRSARNRFGEVESVVAEKARDAVKELRLLGRASASAVRETAAAGTNLVRQRALESSAMLRRRTESTALSLRNKVALARVTAATQRAAFATRAVVAREKIRRDLRENTARWAGVATGLGFALGLTGRVVRKVVARQRHRIPRLIVVERLA